jgi:hypothetical protein
LASLQAKGADFADAYRFKQEILDLIRFFVNDFSVSF